jgi:hypothetical protein
MRPDKVGAAAKSSNEVGYPICQVAVRFGSFLQLDDCPNIALGEFIYRVGL